MADFRVPKATRLHLRARCTTKFEEVWFRPTEQAAETLQGEAKGFALHVVHLPGEPATLVVCVLVINITERSITHRGLPLQASFRPGPPREARGTWSPERWRENGGGRPPDHVRRAKDVLRVSAGANTISFCSPIWTYSARSKMSGSVIATGSSVRKSLARFSDSRQQWHSSSSVRCSTFLTISSCERLGFARPAKGLCKSRFPVRLCLGSSFRASARELRVCQRCIQEEWKAAVLHLRVKRQRHCRLVRDEDGRVLRRNKGRVMHDP